MNYKWFGNWTGRSASSVQFPRAHQFNCKALPEIVCEALFATMFGEVDSGKKQRALAVLK